MIKLKIIFLILFFGILIADLGPVNIGKDETFFDSAFYKRAADFSLVVIATLIVLISISYMAATLFKVPEYLESIKIELRQLFIGVMLGILLFSFAFALDGIITSQFKKSTFDIASNYIRKAVCLSVQINLKLEGLKMVLQYASDMRSRYYAYQYGWGFSVLTFPGLDVWERALEVISFLLFPFIASLMVQEIGLDLIRATAIVYILPAGIVLRLIPMLRDAGSFLIASAFCFFFILPYLYTIEQAVVLEQFKKDFNKEMCASLNTSADETLKTIISGVTLIPDLGFIWDNLWTIFGEFFRLVSYLILIGLVLPAVNMLITVSAIQTISRYISMRLE